MARRTVEGYGRIDTWVNNAGVMVYGFLEEVPSETYRQVIETNLFGQIHGPVRSVLAGGAALAGAAA